MSLNRWVECIQFEAQACTAVANTATETLLAPNLVLPVRYLRMTRVLRLRAWGTFSTTGTPTMTFKVHLGSAGTNADGLVCPSTAITTASGAATFMWRLEMDIAVRAETFGATSANVMAIGEYTITDAATNTKVGQFMPSTNPLVSSPGFNTEVQQNLGTYLTWSAASASNTLTTHLYTVESMT
jgi:hypothetical protein